MPQPELFDLPADVLPSMHFVSQLPGMGVREVDERDQEVTRFWFGKTELNGKPSVVGVAARDKNVMFLLGNSEAYEYWEMQETGCAELSFRRTASAHKPTLVPDAKIDVAVEDEYHPKFTAVVNFCSGDRGYSEVCSHCIFANGQNQDLLANSEGIGRGVIDPYDREPSDFPIRTESDIQVRDTGWEGNPYRGRDTGFGSNKGVLTALAEIKNGIMQATQITPDEALAILPNPTLGGSGIFNRLRV